MTDEIKPCPFCGGNAELMGTRHGRTDIPFKGWVQCVACTASGPVRDAENDAIAAWNAALRPARSVDDALSAVGALVGAKRVMK